MARTTKRTVSASAAESPNTNADVVRQTDESVEPNRVVYKVKEDTPLSPTDYITVRNGFNGKLVYKSKKTGEKFVWQEFGDEQDIELAELKSARNSSKSFFENNWFMFDNPAVISYLGVERMYEHALNIDNFDDIFNMNPEDVKNRISLLSDGQKYSVKYRARTLIRNGTIDSLKMINALEEALDTELIEQ